jgi:hypothetical protein
MNAVALLRSVRRKTLNAWSTSGMKIPTATNTISNPIALLMALVQGFILRSSTCDQGRELAFLLRQISPHTGCVRNLLQEKGFFEGATTWIVAKMKGSVNLFGRFPF